MIPRSASSRRALATLGLLGATGALAAGTYSAFTGSTSATLNVSSGTLTLDAATNSLTIDATDIIPGDTVQRGVNVKKGGSVTATDISVTTTLASGTANVLTSDTTNGLQLKIEKCSAMPAVQGDGSYSCTGAAEVLGTGAVLRTKTAFGLSSVAADNFFRVTVTLPSAADNTFQGLSASVLYTFEAAQRAGTFT